MESPPQFAFSSLPEHQELAVDSFLQNQDIDIRALYENSQTLINALSLNKGLDSQVIEKKQISDECYSDKKLCCSKLQSILGIIVRRLNGFTEKDSLKTFIGLFSNFCYIAPYVNCSNFHQCFTNRFYRKLHQTVLNCYQQWRQSLNCSEERVQFIRFSTLLASLSKMAEDSIKIKKNQILEIGKIFNKNLLNLLLSMYLTDRDRVMIPYLQVLNFTIKLNLLCQNFQIKKCLRAVGYQKTFNAIYHNFIASQTKFENKVNLNILCLLKLIFSEKYMTNHNKSSEHLEPIFLKEHQKQVLLKFCLDVFQYKKLVTYRHQMLSSILQTTFDILQFLLDKDKILIHIDAQWLIKLVSANNVNKQILIFFIGHLNSDQFHKFIFYAVQQVEHHYVAFQKLNASLINKDIAFWSVQQQKHSNSLQQSLKVLDACLEKAGSRDLLWLVSQYRISPGHLSEHQYSSFWEIFNHIFKKVLRYEKIFLNINYIQTSFSYAASIIQRTLLLSKQFPELHYIFKRQFILIHFSGTEEPSLQQKQEGMAFQKLLLQYKLQYLQGEIFKQKNGRVDPNMMVLYSNPFYISIKKLLCNTGVLSGDPLLEEKWGFLIQQQHNFHSVRFH